MKWVISWKNSFSEWNPKEIYYYYFFNLFIYFWLCGVFVTACRLSLVAVSGGYSLRCTGFSLQWLLVAEHRL